MLEEEPIWQNYITIHMPFVVVPVLLISSLLPQSDGCQRKVFKNCEQTSTLTGRKLLLSVFHRDCRFKNLSYVHLSPTKYYSVSNI